MMNSPEKKLPAEGIAPVEYPSRKSRKGLRRSKVLPKSSYYFYKFIWVIVVALFKVFLLMTCKGKRNIPKEGPVIFACNHISHMDPVAIGACSRRRIFYMAKSEIFEYGFLGWLTSKLGAFPVVRDTVDRNAIKITRNLLKENQIVCIFPEGTRNRGIDKARDGVAWFAKKANCPVVPVAVFGTNRVLPTGLKSLRPHKIAVHFGEPIMPSDDLEVMLKEIVGGIGGLLGREDSNKELVEARA